jgi:ABC-type transport system involved in multi-copper enzyme maturation permease subunit
MKISATLSPILKITKYTLADEVRHKSFAVMFLICAGFVLLIRSCYTGSFIVNGQQLDAAAIALYVSKASFHVIAVGAALIAALLSMRILRRDRDEGMQSCVLAKPIARWQYVAGKVLGVWALSALFMFALHFMIFVIAFLSTGAVIPEYLTASLLCSLTVLFVVLAALLLSLLLPEAMVFLCILGVGTISFFGDGIYAVSQSQAAQAMMQHSGGAAPSGLTWWKVVYFVWPKLFALQQWAASFIGDVAFHGFGPVPPLVNVLVYCVILGVLLYLRFEAEDIV